MILDRFPTALLTKSPEERLNYVIARTFRHPIIISRHNKLIELLFQPKPPLLINLIGPTGVGKTTLLRGLIKDITHRLWSELQRDRGRFATAFVTATAPEMGSFSWRDFWIHVLLAMRDAIIANKIRLRGHRLIYTNTDLRLMTVQALIHRRPVFFGIDEAQHLGKMANALRLHHQADALKSLAETTRVPIVLIGTYELLPLLDNNAHFARRSVDVHFSRYNLDLERHRDVWDNVVATFLRHVPLAKEPNVPASSIYERCCGCVGILKDWIVQAYRLHLADPRRPFENALDRTALSPRKLKRIAAEIQTGEEQLKGDPDDLLDVRLTLNTNGKVANTLGRGTGIKIKGRRRRVGERRPSRDIVGRVDKIKDAE